MYNQCIAVLHYKSDHWIIYNDICVALLYRICWFFLYVLEVEFLVEDFQF